MNSYLERSSSCKNASIDRERRDIVKLNRYERLDVMNDASERVDNEWR